MPDIDITVDETNDFGVTTSAAPVIDLMADEVHDFQITVQPAPEVVVGVASVGAQGQSGLSVLSGVGAPSAGLGRNGEFYLDTESQVLYGPKAGGVWGSGQGLIGAARTSVTFAREGLLVPTAGLFTWYAADDWTVLSVRVSVTDAPVGDGIVVDVLRNGESLWADPADRPTIPDGGTEVVVTPDVVSLAAGEHLGVTIEQVGSTFEGSDLLVQIDLEAADATAIDLLTDDRLVVFIEVPGQGDPGWTDSEVTFQEGDGLSFVDLAPLGFVIRVERPGIFAVSAQMGAMGDGWADVTLEHFGPAPNFDPPADAVPMSSRLLVGESGTVLRLDETLRALEGDVFRVLCESSVDVSLTDLRLRVTRLR